MSSMHSSRIAMFCFALTLCLVAPIARAQSSAVSTRSRVGTAPTAETPVFENQLTRATLGTIPNLDDQVAAEARMTPDPDSHMVVMGAKTDVWCPPGKYIELAPNLKITGFTPVTIAVFKDRGEGRTHAWPEHHEDTRVHRWQPGRRRNRAEFHGETTHAQRSDGQLLY